MAEEFDGLGFQKVANLMLCFERFSGARSIRAVIDKSCVWVKVPVLAQGRIVRHR